MRRRLTRERRGVWFFMAADTCKTRMSQVPIRRELLKLISATSSGLTQQQFFISSRVSEIERLVRASTWLYKPLFEKMISGAESPCNIHRELLYEIGSTFEKPLR